MESIEIEFKDTNNGQLVFLNGNDVSSEIRTKEITDFTSQVASISIVREHLVNMQREMAKNKNIVMEGRDIGTNVFPNADMKIYLTASANERVKRRWNELKKNGEEYDFEEVAKSIYKWDSDAVHREKGALKKAVDAITIDTSNLTIDDLLNMVVEKINEKNINDEKGL